VARNAALIPFAVAALIAAGHAAAASNLTFGAAPVTTKQLGPRSYFSFTLEPGGTAQDAIEIANTSKASVELKLGSSTGTTASGSGDAYVGAFTPCRSAACWIHGLPSRITLAPGARRTLAFTVIVPASAPRRQYLAGITVEPAKRPKPTSLGNHGGVGARAVIIRQVNIGVALTVGSLASLPRRLEVTNVAPKAIGTTTKLLIAERNTGGTFLHAKGSATCVRGSFRRVYPVTSDTVLPGDSTTLAVNAEGLVTGAAVQCTVRLDYGGGSASPAATWTGSVKLPKVKPAHVVQTGPHTFSEVPKAGVPRWAIALIAAGAAIVLTLLVVIVVLLRRRPPATA
jgi:hypothetical protein